MHQARPWSIHRSSVEELAPACTPGAWGVNAIAAFSVFGDTIPLPLLELDVRSLTVVFAFSFVMGFELWTRRNNVRGWWIAIVPVVLLLFEGTRLSLDQAAMSVVSANVAVALVALAMLCFLASASATREDRRRSLWLIICFLQPLMLLVAARWITSPEVVGADPDDIEAIVTYALTSAAAISLPFIGGRWYWLAQEEDGRLAPGRKAEERVWAAYLVVIALLFCSVLAGFGVIDAVRPIVDLSIFGAAPIETAPLLAAGAVVAMVFALIAVVRARPTGIDPKDLYPPIGSRLQVPLSIAVTLVLAAASWGLTPWVMMFISSSQILSTALSSIELTFVGGGLMLAGVLVAVWVGFLTRQSLQANISENEFFQLDRRAEAVALASGATTASTVGWLLIVGMWGPSAPAQPASVALATGLVYLGNMLVLTGIGWALSRTWPMVPASPPFMARHHATSHIFNDHMIIGIFVAITVTVSYVIYLTSEALVGSARLIATLIQLSALLAIAPAFERIMAVGMKKHVDDEWARKISPALVLRAGAMPGEIDRLNAERIRRIDDRFERGRRVSQLLSILFLLLAVRGLLALLGRVF